MPKVYHSFTSSSSDPTPAANGRNQRVPPTPRTARPFDLSAHRKKGHHTQHPHMADNVSIKDLAKRLRVNPSTVSRLIERFGSQLGISLQKGRGNAWNAKWTHYLSREDADRLIA